MNANKMIELTWKDTDRKMSIDIDDILFFWNSCGQTCLEIKNYGTISVKE